mmetsp:Transcript_6281/g.6788  ORF Transcript_6281/g.6788 Transcript_6281/m.6788 type:complete len:697 (+) Transcript_6281:90-2180(+)
MQQFNCCSVNGMLGDESNNDMIDHLRMNIIGDRCIFKTPFGNKEIVYADYTASGRALKFVEDYVLEVAIPTYANTHTEASTTGAQTTHLREEARDMIHQATNAPSDEYVVLFTGTGATGAIEKLFRVLGLGISEFAEKKWNLSNHIPLKQRPVVFVSHYEHHSNELMWRESIARCVVIEEGADGTPDIAHLKRELIKYKKEKVPMIGSFSAGSNVTGIQSPVRDISALLHQHGAYAFFDYAGVGAYVDINMKGTSEGYVDDSIDAGFFSPHKFIGGPGSSGVLIARKKLFHKAFDIETTTASTPGGGTIDYVWHGGQAYSQDIEYREDSGTPGILQSIRAGLAFKVKDMVGSQNIEKLEGIHSAFVLNEWNQNDTIAMMGSDRLCYHLPNRRVSIFSFNLVSPVPVTLSILDEVDEILTESSTEDPAKEYEDNTIISWPIDGAANHIAQTLHRYATIAGNRTSNGVTRIPLHYNFVIALLNDVYGIQGRGGCSCAGPYAEALFDGRSLEKSVGEQFMKISASYPAFKYGWARININYFTTEDEAWFIVKAVKQIAKHGWKLLPLYTQMLESGQYIHHSYLAADGTVMKATPKHSINDLNIGKGVDQKKIQSKSKDTRNKKTWKMTKRSSEIDNHHSRDRAYFQKILSDANDLYNAEMKMTRNRIVRDFTNNLPDDYRDNVWWLLPSQAESFLSCSC